VEQSFHAEYLHLGMLLGEVIGEKMEMFFPFNENNYGTSLPAKW
jgi:hypothetical protein